MVYFYCRTLNDYNRITPATTNLIIDFNPPGGILPKEVKLPIGLTLLSCSDKGIISLPELPEGLTHLSCHDNKIRALPEFPKSLVILTCSNNKLTALPELPETLKILDCHNNNLNTLPVLPEILTYLRYDGNKFVEPFLTYLKNYDRTNDLNGLKKSIKRYYLRKVGKLLGVLLEVNNDMAVKNLQSKRSLNPRVMTIIGEAMGAKPGFTVSKQLGNIRRMYHEEPIYQANIPTPHISNAEFSRLLTKVEEQHLKENRERVKLRYSRRKAHNNKNKNNRTLKK
jgi:hypothetical protein